MIYELSICLTKFWCRHPALLYGLSALVGVFFAFSSFYWVFLSVIVFLIGLPLLSLSSDKKGVIRLLLACGVLLTSFLFSRSHHQFPQKEDLGLVGVAEIQVDSISLSKSAFGALWFYKGTLRSFTNAENIVVAKNIPVSLTIPFEKDSTRPLASHRYAFKAKLKENKGHFSLKNHQIGEWVAYEKAWNLVEWRNRMKLSLQQFIFKALSDRHVASFLAGMATGEFDDIELSSELGRFGLQHLMAISGLHFAILASFLGFLVCLFFSTRVSALIVVVILTAYFIFLGWSPSVMRAWIAITITLGGLLFAKRSQALNSLGLGLLAIALGDPLLLYSIAFQFSFGITAAILLWYGPCDRLLQNLFAKRTLSQMAEVDWLTQHGYCVLCFLRQAFSLTLAINLVALPLTLYYFNKFPLLGFLYNLFFPTMVSLSLCLLILASLINPIIPWISTFLHLINETYTKFLLNFTFNLPKTFDYVFYTEEINLSLLIGYVILLFFGGVFAKSKIKGDEFQ